MKKLGTLKVFCPNCDALVGHMLAELGDVAKVREVLVTQGVVMFCDTCFKKAAIDVKDFDYTTMGFEK